MPASNHFFGVHLALLIAVFVFSALVIAEDTTTSIDSCPQQLTDDEIIYSPFTAWFSYYHGSSQKCWNWASCVFLAADESRKQQFSATALVMGLVPLTFKDIAWPGRRAMLLSREPPWYFDIVVRALGLEPISLSSGSTDANQDQITAWWTSSWLAERTWDIPWVALALSSFSLFCAGGVLLLTEFYSKRSALGCIYAGFVLSWYVVALIPAAIHTNFGALRRRYQARQGNQAFGPPANSSSAVQGGEEWWVVQLGWAVYYIAGTLIYTSIMAVTVIELLVWVLASAAMTAACKMLGFFICMVLEKKSRPHRERSSVRIVDAEGDTHASKAFNLPEAHELLTRKR